MSDTSKIQILYVEDSYLSGERTYPVETEVVLKSDFDSALAEKEKQLSDAQDLCMSIINSFGYKTHCNFSLKLANEYLKEYPYDEALSERVESIETLNKGKA